MIIIIIAAIAAAALVTAFFLEQHKQKTEYMNNKQSQFETAMEYLQVDISQHPTFDSNGPINFRTTPTLIIINAYLDDSKALKDESTFIAIIRNGPPSENPSFWQPISSIDTDLQKYVYYDFMGFGDFQLYSGWGYLRKEQIVEKYIGGPDSTERCLYKTFLDHKQHYDIFMDSDYPEYCVDGEIPLDTDIMEWPFEIAYDLVDRFQKGK